MEHLTQNKIEVKGFTPHLDQLSKIELIENPNVKYITLTTGRQWGKTMLAQNLLLKWGLENNSSTLMWVSPVYSQCRKVFTDIVNAIEGTPILKSANKSNLNIILVNGTKLLFRSGERQDTLRGYTLDYLIVDEAAYLRDDVWNLVLKQTTLVKGKKVLFISTPKGKNYFYRLAARGLSEDDPSYLTLVGSSYDTPYISNDELEEAKRTLPEDIFRQEILGHFIDSGGEVFTNIDNYCVLDNWELPVSTNKYYAGIDFGRQNDYSVLTIIDENGKVVYVYRDRHKSWDDIIKNMADKLKQYKAQAQVEINSIGDVLFENLKKLYPNIHPFLTSSSSKQNIIEDLIYATNELKVSLPTEALFSPLYQELKLFTYEYSMKTRNIKYSAPQGAHDDTIMSLAIAYNTIKERKTKGVYNIYTREKKIV